MWRRAPSHLRPLAGWRSAAVHRPRRRGGETLASASASAPALFHSSSPSPMPFRCTPPLFSSDAPNPALSNKVEDVMPIATGLEREEIAAELEGKKRFDMDAPAGPFGTKEAPAVIQSYYNKRIVGCPGGEGEDEHDVVWFWLEKDKPHQCPVCSQYFVLEVIGDGGDPDGHSDHEHHQGG